MSENYRRKETKYCGECKTIELDVKLRELVEKLVGRKKVETVVVDDKSRKGVLFVRLVSGEFRWFEDGDEDKDGKYVGEIENDRPNGKGTLIYRNGTRYDGEYTDGAWNGMGTFYFPDGEKWVGE